MGLKSIAHHNRKKRSQDTPFRQEEILMYTFEVTRAFKLNVLEIMADGDSSRGADWEVVALTASTYVASPGPDAGPSDDYKNREFVREQESSAIFLSDHFVFPPHEHENLPIELDCCKVPDHPGIYGILPIEDGLEPESSINSMEFQEGQTHGFSNAEVDCGPMVHSDDENDVDDYDSSNQHDNMPSDFAQCGETSDGGKSGESILPYEAWWKRHVISLYKQAKETNTYWSICVAAAVMGLVVLGQQWQREKIQLQRLKLQFSITNERMSRMLGSLTGFKDVLIAAHQRRSLIHAGTASNI
ncbi:hypothetical protein HPP92_025783 [Vanilla planifolia]|uniref:Uncharacterized protein n=1 Tax=Vanilla planifolia TaxID=51239 RepID=A0A835PJV9_VANPL|nr:hypothetical protein HPP92_025783 [Vanilla planifolia]